MGWSVWLWANSFAFLSYSIWPAKTCGIAIHCCCPYCIEANLKGGGTFYNTRSSGLDTSIYNNYSGKIWWILFTCWHFKSARTHYRHLCVAMSCKLTHFFLKWPGRLFPFRTTKSASSGNSLKKQGYKVSPGLTFLITKGSKVEMLHGYGPLLASCLHFRVPRMQVLGILSHSGVGSSVLQLLKSSIIL